MRPPVHLRDAQTGKIACGAAHRPFSGHPCCRIDPALVTCEECQQVAGIVEVKAS